MRNVLFFALTLFVTIASAQNEITYPYNPDSDGDQYVSVSDVLSTISSFGSEFNPAEIQIDGIGLYEVITQMQVIIIELQDEINTLQLQNQWPSVVNGHLIISGADLSGAYLSNADLAGANLTNANLDGADLSGADLAYADLAGAILYNANLYSANLAGAILVDANLAFANLAQADLTNANLSFTNLFDANLSGVTWTGAYIEGCIGCDCIDADGDNICD